jgi:dienelactone hydrolase
MEAPSPSLQERYALAASLTLGRRDASLLHGPVQAQWAPDGRHFWYASRDAAGPCWQLVDVEARCKRPLVNPSALAGALGQALGKTIEPGALALSALSFDAASSNVSFATEGALWSWQGESAALARLGAAFGPEEDVAPSGDAAVSNAGPNLRLRRADRRDQPIALTDDGEPWRVQTILHIDEAGRQILFTASRREPGVDPYFRAAYRVNFDGGGLKLLTPEPAQHELIRPVATPAGWPAIVSPDGSYFIDNHSTVTSPPRSLLRDRDGAVLMTLEIADPGDAWPKALPPPEPFSVSALNPEALDGAGELWGGLYKPLDFDPSQRYPIVEVVYGGPQTAVAPKSWGAAAAAANGAEQLAALGFVVVIVDGPGTPFRSRAFQQDSYGHIESRGGLPDHVNAIRRLAVSRPWMDIDRVGIIGASGGGYATVRAMATFPDFYKVGVAMCGNHDQAGYIAGWGDRYQGPYDEALYATQANKTVASRIVGDLLLIHVDLDNNVHPALTMQLVDALIKADCNFDLLIVPNAMHSVFAMPYVQRRMFDHLVEHLMGVPPPRPRPKQSRTE